jgi:hypothetical protein
MKEQDPVLPSLPYKIRTAMEAARSVRPSLALERRVWRAIEDVERERQGRPKVCAGRLSTPFGFMMAGAIAAGLALGACLFCLRGGRGEGGASFRDLAVQIPDIGHVWVDLPVDTQQHDAEAVSVAFDAPASVALHVADAQPPEGVRSECGGLRCVHRWETGPDLEDGSTPRVRITEPGRYEFSVVSSSSEQRYEQRFVVVAME